MPQSPAVGRTVLYTLSEYEADALNEKHRDEIGRTLNAPHANQAYPAVIVAVWSDTCVNLRVQLDGEPTYWATSRALGHADEAGRWAWPTITPAPAAGKEA